MKENKWISLKQASELSGKNCQQLRRMISSGKLKAIKDGRSWAINPSDLDLGNFNYLEKKEDGGNFCSDESETSLSGINLEKKSFMLTVLPEQLGLVPVVAALLLLSLFFSLLLGSGMSLKASFSKVKQEKYIPTEQEKIISHSIFGD